LEKNLINISEDGFAQVLVLLVGEGPRLFAIMHMTAQYNNWFYNLIFK
jgi:hypothetical protein